jgi:hypothetical protein
VSVLDLPPGVRHWLRPALSDQPLMPASHAQCRSVPVAEGVLSIRSPADGARYLLLASSGQRLLNLPLELLGSGTPRDVSCVLNGRQLHLAPQRFRPVLQLEHGRYHLFCSSMEGGSDEVHFAVESPVALPRLR